MNTTTIQKWGNSYAVRLPKAVVEKLKLRAGHAVRVEEMVEGRSLSIVPVAKRSADLADLVGRITLKNRHTETDWGAVVGNEIW